MLAPPVDCVDAPVPVTEPDRALEVMLPVAVAVYAADSCQLV